MKDINNYLFTIIYFSNENKNLIYAHHYYYFRILYIFLSIFIPFSQVIVQYLLIS
jgi:hypothetical protein